MKDRTHATTATRRTGWAIIAFTLLLALWNGAINPLFEPPDELLHYRFVRHLINEQTLPIQEIDGEKSHSHHPPLYYLMGALLTAGIEDSDEESAENPHWTSYRSGEVHRDNKNLYLRDRAHRFPWRGTALVAHTLRLFSTALFAGTLLLTRKITDHLFPTSPDKRTLLLALVAFNPMLIYLGSAFNNDNLLIFIGTALLLTTIRAFEKNFPWPLTLLIGGLYGLAILTKLNGIVLGAVWGSALVIKLIETNWASSRDLSTAFVHLLQRGVVIVALALLMSGWWFARNVAIYGDLFGFRIHFAVWGHRTEEAFNFRRLVADSLYAFSNFWGRFGYGQINLHGVVYWFFAALVLLALGGAVRQLANPDRPALRPVWYVLAIGAGMLVVAMFYYLVRVPVGANARYVFPMIAAIGALLAQGLSAWAWLRPKWLAVALGVIATYAIGFVTWTYAVPRSVAQFEAAYCWDSAVCISQPIVTSRMHAASGEQEIVVDACWHARAQRPTNDVFFTHLLDIDLNPLGARNTHLGNGRYPSTLLAPGTTFCETVVVPVSAEIAQPIAAHVEIGLYDATSGERYTAVDTANNTYDWLTLSRIRIDPTTDEERPSTETVADFSGVELLAYTLTPQDDGHYLLETAWRATATLPYDYTLFAHLLDANDNLLTQADGPLGRDTLPTSLWVAGDVVYDVRQLPISPEASHLRLGFYNPQDGTRLPRSAPSNPPDAVDLPLP